MTKSSVVLIGASARTQGEIARALREVAAVTVAAVDGADGLRDYLVANPAVVIVAVDDNVDASLRLITDLTGAGIRVLVVASKKDPDVILGAMRAGAREFVLETNHEELRKAVRSLSRGGEESAPKGGVITLFPTRGGVGATSIACNLAGVLARRGEQVCLVDFDLYLGDVLSFLDLPGSYSMTDVLANMTRLDRELLDNSITRHGSGVRVLSQSGKVEEAEAVRAAEVPQLLGFLRQHYDRIVVDGVRGFDELALSALDASHKLVLVLTQDVPAVRNAKRCLDLIRRLGYPDERMFLVLNRFAKDSKITPEVIADTVGLPVGHTLANDFGAAIESINRGQMLMDAAPRSKLTNDIEELAPALVGQPRNGVRRTSGFFRNLLSKRGDNGTAGTS